MLRMKRRNFIKTIVDGKMQLYYQINLYLSYLIIECSKAFQKSVEFNRAVTLYFNHVYKLLLI